MLLGIPVNSAFPVVKIMEFLMSGLDNEDFVLEICEEREMNGAYALTVPGEKSLKIREDVYREACYGNPRHLFTLSHELGHVIFHTTNTIALARNDEKVENYENPEWQANTFAAELMVPADEIIGMTIEEVMDTYNCSYTVASIQLQQSLHI